MTAAREEASLGELPPCIARPWWREPPASRAPVVIQVEGPTLPDVMVWPPSLQRTWAADDDGPYCDVTRSMQRRAALEGLGALEDVLLFCKGGAREGIGALLPFRSTRVAPAAARALGAARWRREAAAWLEAHPEHATAGLLAPALGRLTKARSSAEAALLHLSRRGHGAQVAAVAARAGDAPRRAIEALLSGEARHLLPDPVPPLPSFAAHHTLPRPILNESGRLVPAAVMDVVVTIVARSRLEVPCAAVRALREAFTRPSLSALSAALLARWLDAGAPEAETWALDQVAMLGDEASAERLATLLAAWPLGGAHGSALRAVDVLAAMEHDAALRHVHRIAETASSKRLRTHAGEAREAAARARGLSADDLADRLVVASSKDGSVDARLLASEVARLEEGMRWGRRWGHAAFGFLVAHPVLGPLARRLVWSAHGPQHEPAPIRCFAITDDGQLVDGAGRPFFLAPTDEVLLAHPAVMGAAQVRAWTTELQRRGLDQPFPQLGRETAALDAEAAASDAIGRWRGRATTTGAVRALEARGWRRGALQDGGSSPCLELSLATRDADVTVYLGLAPGLTARTRVGQEQKLLELTIDANAPAAGTPPATFASLGPVAFSEIVRDVEWLVTGPR